MRMIFALLGFLLFMACGNPTASDSPTSTTVKLPEALAKGLVAHGGLENWQKMEGLQFAFQKDSVTKELHQINLKTRKTLITRGDVKVGFDGEEVWVSPNKAAFGKGSARFYHSVYYYFYAMPYVLADPGINYEEVAARMIDGKSCPGVKITYGANVGDAPDDYYIAYFDPETNLLYGLLYTVTYGDGKPNENFSALKYEKWQRVNGLLVPELMVWYKFENDDYGEKRRGKIFTEVQVSDAGFEEGIFERPEGAEVDHLEE